MILPFRDTTLQPLSDQELLNEPDTSSAVLSCMLQYRYNQKRGRNKENRQYLPSMFPVSTLGIFLFRTKKYLQEKTQDKFIHLQM